jgi:hypothetical protein
MVREAAMKKPKIKLDKAKIQAFFVSHTEKIIFAIMVLVLLKMLWGAYGREVYTRTAQELQQTADRARATLQAASWNSEIEKQQFPDAIASYVELAKTKPIQPTDYQIEPPLMASVLPTSSKRSKPEVFAVTDLQVHADYGPFSIEVAGTGNKENKTEERNESAGEGAAEDRGRGASAQGYMWAVITGLIPYERQVTEFSKRFKNAATQGTNGDQPLYKGYYIERAEVRTGNEPDEELKWVAANYRSNSPELAYHKFRTQEAFRSRWAGPAKEVVVGEIIPETAYPLGPLAGREWGIHVGHSKLPSNLAQPELVDEVDEAIEEPAVPPADDPFNAAAAVAPQKPKPGAANDGNKRRKVDPKLVEEGARYRLFRYFDFHVEEGKRYRYRVRLVMENPNFQIDPRFLEDAQLAKAQTLLGAWSEPSPVVTVPRANNLLAGAAKNVAGELGAKVLVRQFNRLAGDDSWAEQEMWRGQMANFENVQVQVSKARGGSEQAKSSLKTDTLLVDIADAPPIQVQGRRFLRPTQLVLLDPDGQLVVRTETEDRADYADRLDSASPQDDSAAGRNPTSDERKDVKKDRGGLGKDGL